MDIFNHFSAIGEQLHNDLAKVIVITAKDAGQNIQDHITSNEQVDTGEMYNSVYTVTSEGSTYTSSPHALPSVDAPEDDLTAYVGVAASYAGYQNYGTRFLPARPFFEPGLQDAQENLQTELDAVAAKFGGS